MKTIDELEKEARKEINKMNKHVKIHKDYFELILEEYELHKDESSPTSTILYDKNNNIICIYDGVEDPDSGEYEEVLHSILNYFKIEPTRTIN